MTTISFIYVIVAMNTISLRPPLWNNKASQQAKVFPIKKTYHCRNLSISISNSTTMVGTSEKIILLWTTWFDINFVESLGNSRPITCGPKTKGGFSSLKSHHQIFLDIMNFSHIPDLYLTGH